MKPRKLIKSNFDSKQLINPDAKTYIRIIKFISIFTIMLYIGSLITVNAQTTHFSYHKQLKDADGGNILPTNNSSEGFYIPIQNRKKSIYFFLPINETKNKKTKTVHPVSNSYGIYPISAV